MIVNLIFLIIVVIIIVIFNYCLKQIKPLRRHRPCRCMKPCPHDCPYSGDECACHHQK